MRQTSALGVAGVALLQTHHDFAALLMFTKAQISPGKEAHDQKDGQGNPGESHDFADDEFQTGRGLGYHGVNHAIFDFAREIAAGEDDRTDDDDQAGGEETEFGDFGYCRWDFVVEYRCLCCDFVIPYLHVQLG